MMADPLLTFDEESAEQAADAQAFEETEWISSGKITLPKTTLRDKKSFVAGARYQYLEDQELIKALKEENSELKRFREDAIKMAADFYINQTKPAKR